MNEIIRSIGNLNERGPVVGSTSGARVIRAPRGSGITAQGWQQEAAMRMLMNNLAPEVAEHP